MDEPSPYETPNLDRFAKSGVMFWQAYSPAPTCSPSRCRSAMMDPWFSGHMPEDTFTLARALEQNGYFIGHVVLRGLVPDVRQTS
ncbi:sulfatase-like hydrolase/transferase [Luteolibacter sp. AS25]